MAHMERNAWDRLAGDYEAARQRDDSFDRILEWPAQRRLLGDVTGLRILDVGCGSGAKGMALADAGADSVVGVDITGTFVQHTDPRVQLLQGDLSALDEMSALRGRMFDRITFFQSISYASDQVRTLTAARSLLAQGGRILVQRSHPIRFAVERTEVNGTTLGEEYYSTEQYSYRSGWNSTVTLTHSTETFSDMLNTFAAAELCVESAVEPQLAPEMRERYPHKQDWLNRYLGVVLFTLRPSSDGR